MPWEFDALACQLPTPPKRAGGALGQLPEPSFAANSEVPHRPGLQSARLLRPRSQQTIRICIGIHHPAGSSTEHLSARPSKHNINLALSIRRSPPDLPLVPGPLVRPWLETQTPPSDVARILSRAAITPYGQTHPVPVPVPVSELPRYSPCRIRKKAPGSRT